MKLTRRHVALVEQLRAQLSESQRAAYRPLRIANVRGKGGVGKTTLATCYGATVIRDVSFAFLLNSESPETIVRSFVELARLIVDYYASSYYYSQSGMRAAKERVEVELGLPNMDDMIKIGDKRQHDPVSVGSVLKGVKNWLLMEGNDWVLIFDNIPDATPRPGGCPAYDVMDYVPWTLQGQVVLVSQGPRGCGTGSSVTVPDWNEDDAAELLQAHLDNAPSDANTGE